MCGCLHSAIRGSRDLDSSQSGVNDVTKQVVVGKAMREHSVECVEVGQRQFIFAM